MSKLERWLPFKFKRKTGENGGRVPVRVQRGTEQPALQALAPLLSPSLQQLVQNFWNDPFFRDPFARFSELDRWFGDFSPARFSPSIDVADEEDTLKISAELPGLSKDDFELSVDGGVLTIRGEKKNEEETRESGVYRSERYYGYFERSIPLPEDVDPDRIDASYDRGVLTVRVPKTRRESTSRKIPIRV